MLIITVALAMLLWVISRIKAYFTLDRAESIQKLNKCRKSFRLISVAQFALLVLLFLFESNFSAIREILYSVLSDNTVSVVRFLLYITLCSSSAVKSLYIASFFAIVLFAFVAAANLILCIGSKGLSLIFRRNKIIEFLKDKNRQKQGYKPVIIQSYLNMVLLKLRI